MDRIRQYLMPSLSGSLIYLTVGGGALFASAGSLIFSRIGNNTESTRFLENLIESRFEQSLNFFDNFKYSADIATILVWSCIGAVAYLLFMLTLGFLSEASFSFVSEVRFIHPRGYHHGEFFKTLLLRSIYHFVVVSLIIFYVIVLTQQLWPVWTELLSRFVLEPSFPTGIGWLLASTAGILLSLHVLTILLRVLFLRTRLLDGES